MEENSGWRNIISLKYGMKNWGWFSNIPKGSYGVCPLKEISKEALKLKQNCSFEVGDGAKLDFGRVLSAERSLCVRPFPSFMRW